MKWLRINSFNFKIIISIVRNIYHLVEVSNIKLYHLINSYMLQKKSRALVWSRISPATTIHLSTKPFLVPGCGSSCYCPAAVAWQASITQLISIKRHCKCLYQQGLRLKTMYTLGHSLSVYITVVWTQYRHHIK